MVRRGPADDEDGATVVFPAVKSARRPGFEDSATVVIPPVNAPRRAMDDTPTQRIRPVGQRPAGVGGRPPAARLPVRTPAPEPGRPHRHAAPRKKSSRAVKTLRTFMVIVVLVLAGLGGMAFGLQSQIGSNLSRITIGALGGNRPVVVAPQAQNILLVGSDSRTSKGNAGQWVKGDQRTDAIMLVHVAADRKSVDVLSIPRDSWVSIPGYGDSKINSAYAEGGPAMLIQTVEQLTGVRIDHLAIADFTGFVAMTDALGGVKITVPETTGDSRNHFEAGTHLMTGKQALGYVRQRHNLPGGDFDRMKRQQNWIRAVIKEAMSKDTLTNPVALTGFLDAATKSITVDRDWSTSDIRDLAISLRSLRSTDIRFMTAPNLGTDWEGDQSVVRLDDVKGPSLYSAIATDQVTTWLTANKPELLGDTVR
jgi:LCP family protein required for cell wall assembly